MKNLYSDLFSRAYRMNYEAFTHLYSLLKNGMKDYLSFYVHNGPIDGEVCLLMALQYFAGGSYLYIMISHGVGKMNFYQSVWCVVHAVNTCPQLQLSHNKIVKTWPLNSLVSPKLDLTTVLVVLMACCYGWKSQANNNLQRLVLIVANSTVEEKVIQTQPSSSM